MSHTKYDLWLDEPLRAFTIYTSRFGSALRFVVTEHDMTEASMLRPDVVAVQTLYRLSPGQEINKRTALNLLASSLQDLADGIMVEVDSQ